MKGVIFTEFLEMIERDFGIETVDAVIADSKVDGIYTSVGTYPDSEMNEMVVSLGKILDKDVAFLHEYFGKSLFHGLLASYPHFFSDDLSLFDFINSIHNYIHVEVKKLYYDAELPDIIVQNQSEKEIVVLYSSKRKYGKIAKGLLLSTIEYFNENAMLNEEKIDDVGEQVLFTISIQ